ncbi:hypothetical protein DSM00_489 [Leeuwenhoekiella aequorea]|uniref:Uncharacterized protein n=1 Tax=Leeuwenhoekiella aequorea TaxID=283736 RepID=A0A4Q0PD17_9FLAO|nr:hypothetical protein DSM00_489 [Leeuwenhoekiella aequorea]
MKNSGVVITILNNLLISNVEFNDLTHYSLYLDWLN